MNLGNLKELGLSDGQIAVYSATLELGTSTLNSIHEKTGIERRNIYDILNKLIERGFISYTLENGKRTYQCTSPNNIIEEIKRKKTALDTLEKETSQITNMFNLSKPNIRAEVYRGNEALKALLEEILNYKESFWIGGNSSVYNTNLKVWFNHWMARRVEKKHMMYDLVDHGTWLEGLKPGDKTAHKKSHYQYCALPKNLASPLIIIIFGNKVTQILWSKQPFAFVLESEEIKESFMKYFHYFWKKA
ncbi:MAG TPA: helix-turn-helix domain-containing protein [Candidatus Nanoarchaeia archaeon]|nr:helix-turn-helix domain-containing protein [Candidatus Nanoarchaeia archaeon]